MSSNGLSHSKTSSPGTTSGCHTGAVALWGIHNYKGRPPATPPPHEEPTAKRYVHVLTLSLPACCPVPFRSLQRVRPALTVPKRYSRTASGELEVHPRREGSSAESMLPEPQTRPAGAAKALENPQVTAGVSPGRAKGEGREKGRRRARLGAQAAAAWTAPGCELITSPFACGGRNARRGAHGLVCPQC